ncbi:MAG: MJ0042-type zinc finger domain-containing protein [Nitrospinales bacterium]
MNISCPDCYAVYEVDIPDLEENGEIDVKCVKCECVFAVHGEPAFSNVEDGEGRVGSQSIGSTAIEEESEHSLPKTSPQEDELVESEYSQPQNPSQDDELDDFLDNLIEREISDAANEPFSDDNEEASWVKNPDDPTDQKIDQENESNLKEYSTANEIDPNSFDEEESNWAKAFEDDTNPEPNEEENSTSDLEFESNEDSSGNVDDLWSKAFSEEELGGADFIDEQRSSGDNQSFYTDIELDPDKEESETTNPYSLEYDNEDENFDDFDLKPKKKSGLFSVNNEKTKSLVVAGMIVGVLLIGGSAYFAFQTFAPEGLAEIKKPDSPIPEGLTPKNSPDENIFSTEDDVPEKPATIKVPSDNKPVQEVKTGIAAELAKSKILEESEGVNHLQNDGRVDKSTFAAINPAETQVTMSAILPVAYDANDIKILSFTLELDLSNQTTAQHMRDTLQVYENIMVAGVEGLTRNQFFNDIIYVKEKLRKRFMSDFNESLQGGRVSKARFREFLIQ